jgi:hypothetical protein
LQPFVAALFDEGIGILKEIVALDLLAGNFPEGSGSPSNVVMMQTLFSGTTSASVSFTSKSAVLMR